MINEKIRYQIFKLLSKDNPNPTIELKYNTEFELLIAVILSAQATDKSVNKVTKELFTIANTPKEFLELGEESLKRYIRTIGLFNSKATNIIKTCTALIKYHDSKIPSDRKLLEALPGVGRKTANVILNTIFNQLTIAVDTHIFRVSNRTGIATGKTPLEVEKRLLRLVPRKFLKNTHHWLLLHGRYVCIARKPRCYQCIINHLCEYNKKKERILL